jgi:hypothetical protein
MARRTCSWWIGVKSCAHDPWNQKQIEGDLREQYGLGTRLLFCVDAHAAARVTHRGIIGMVENEKSIGRVLTSRSVTHRQQR